MIGLVYYYVFKGEQLSFCSIFIQVNVTGYVWRLTWIPEDEYQEESRKQSKSQSRNPSTDVTQASPEKGTFSLHPTIDILGAVTMLMTLWWWQLRSSTYTKRLQHPSPTSVTNIDAAPRRRSEIVITDFDWQFVLAEKWNSYKRQLPQ